PNGFYIPGVINNMLLPFRVTAWILMPANIFPKPAACYIVDSSIVIHIHGNGCKIVPILSVSLDLPDLLFLCKIWSFIPKSSGNDIQTAVIIHIENPNRFKAFRG